VIIIHWDKLLCKLVFLFSGGVCQDLLYRHEYFTGKYTTRKIHTKPQLELEWRIFHILTNENIDDFTDIKFFS